MSLRKFFLLFGLIAYFPLSALVSIEGEVGTFFPISGNLRSIYGVVWPNFGITVDHLQPFSNPIKPLAFFGQANYIFARGDSQNGNQSTSIQLVPITFGLKWIQKVHDQIDGRLLY